MVDTEINWFITPIRDCCAFPRLANVNIMQLHQRGVRFSQPQVEHFYEHREAHREIDVTFGNILVQAFDDQREADQQKTQCQHFNGGMAIHKLLIGAADRSLRQDEHGGNHDPNLIHHPRL